MLIDAPGCGRNDHDAECLCDVIVTHPVPISEDLRHGWFAKEIMEHHSFAAPLKGARLLDFLETWTNTHDVFIKSTTPVPPSDSPAGTVRVGSRFKSDGAPWRVYVKRRFLEGADRKTVQQEVLDLYGHVLSRANANAIRHRAHKATRGEYQLKVAA